MLTKMKTPTGFYFKYQPTKEEIIKMFSEWKRFSILRPSEINDSIKDNLTKWNMMDLYNEIKTTLKKIN